MRHRLSRYHRRAGHHHLRAGAGPRGTRRPDGGRRLLGRPRRRDHRDHAAPSADVVLVRPYGHVAFAGADAGGLEDALRTWFGLPQLAAAF
ncbi:hypothetical protein [Umezawaea beigongshangensis]|uniref:aromatic-ring hydroxylase C-terminal domain-containing protein n=1 Tax=Umezawaea beigongshangensis TaxID=2780383 RepID=UPI003F6840C1